MNQKMQTMKPIAEKFKILKPLFQVNSYLYAQSTSTSIQSATSKITMKSSMPPSYLHLNPDQYLYENEEPSQILKMLAEKLNINQKSQIPNLIFPFTHVKDSFHEKQISLFFMKDYLLPLKFYEKQQVVSMDEALDILHGGINCLNSLHMREIVHGKISLNTVYFIKKKGEVECKFGLNILDTSYFVDEDYVKTLDESIFESEGQCHGLKISYKDDLESLIYVVVHLLSKGKLFTVQRYKLEWVTHAEFLRWKTCDLYTEMLQIIPPQLDFLIQIYTMIKSMARNDKPEYLKIMKKILLIMASREKNNVKTKTERQSLLKTTLAKRNSNQPKTQMNSSNHQRKYSKQKQNPIAENLVHKINTQPLNENEVNEGEIYLEIQLENQFMSKRMEKLKLSANDKNSFEETKSSNYK